MMKNLKILQINLNRCKAAQDDLEERVKRESVDLCILSEVNRKILERKMKQDKGWIGDSTGDSAIWIANGKQIAIKMSSSGEGITSILLDDNTLILSCYFSPNKTSEEFTEYLERIDEKTRAHRGPTLVAGDLNAHSRAWGSPNTDARGIELEETLAQNDLFIVNVPVDPARAQEFCTTFIDITAASNPSSILRWAICGQEESSSDHPYIDYEIETNLTRAPDPDCKFNLRKLDKQIATEYIDEECQNLVDQATAITAAQVASILREACLKASPRILDHLRKKKPAYWWTPAVDTHRKKCIAARRRYTRSRSKNNIDPTTAEQYRRSYTEMKQEYHRAIIQAKKKCWRELVETLRQDPWGLPYKIVREKLGQKRIRLATDVIDGAVRELFPNGVPPARELKNRAVTDIQPVTAAEVKRAAERMANRKAPGPDGVPAEILKILMARWPKVFARMMDEILKTGIFPDSWKSAKLVLIPKPGRANSFRPICLLDTIAKGAESIINHRLQNELEENGGLSEEQYGFRAGRSTLQAIQRVTKLAAEEKQKQSQRRCRIMMILLDVKNAFNSVDWGVILDSLKKKQIPEYLRRILESYLENRWIMDDEGRKHKMTAGVPQGSVLGPTLWNVAYDDVLQLRLPKGASTIAYADDLAIKVRGKRMEDVEEIAQDSLDIIVEWMRNSRLSLAPQKTEAVMLIKRHKDLDPQLRIMGHTIEIQKSARYLGVQLQRNLSGVTHVKTAAEKAAKAAQNIARILPRTYGATEGQRRVLSAVAESIALYAAPIWGPAALRLKKNRDQLERTQRIMAIRITRAYRTTPTQSLFVLARTIPWPLVASERAELYARYNPDGDGNTEEDEDEDRPREEVEEETMRKWQEVWDSADRGRWTHQCIPNIKAWHERDHGDLTYHTTQVLTNHGNFQKYLCRFKKVDSPTCILCDSGKDDDAHHTVLECPALKQPREQLRANSIPELVQQMLSSGEQWDRITRKMECIMKKKDVLLKKRIARTNGAATAP